MSSSDSNPMKKDKEKNSQEELAIFTLVPQLRELTVFRRNALEERSGGKWFLDPPKFIGFPTVTMIAALIFGLTALLIWLFNGTVSTYVSGPAIFRMEDTSYHNIKSEAAGRLFDVAVKVGDIVEEGQTLAKMRLPDMENQIARLDQSVQNLRSLQTIALAAQDDKIRLLDSQNEKKRRSLNNLIEGEQRTNDRLAERIKAAEDLRAAGHATEQYLDGLLERLEDSESKLTNLNNSLDALDFEIQAVRQEYSTIKLDYDLRAIELERLRDTLQSELKQKSQVTAPYNSTVISLEAREDELLQFGSPIMTLASHAGGRLDQAMAFIELAEKDKVRPGMSVLITPADLQKEKHGSIVGTVVTIRNAPETPLSLRQKLSSDMVQRDIATLGAPVLTTIELERHADAPDYLAWTTNSINSYLPSNGGLAHVSIIVEQEAPITLFLPKLREIFGVHAQ